MNNVGKRGFSVGKVSSRHRTYTAGSGRCLRCAEHCVISLLDHAQAFQILKPWFLQLDMLMQRHLDNFAENHEK